MTELQSSLGLFINSSGKMRMLSHRVAMYALLCQSDGADKSACANAFDTALDEFTSIFETLCGKQGDSESKAAANYVLSHDAIAPSALEIIKNFLARSRELRTSFDTSQGMAPILALTELVAGPLLASLNAITNAVTHLLEELSEQNRAEQEMRHKALMRAAGTISDVSRKVRLISLNASVEAARAGEAGKGFAVIASEIHRLSEEAGQSSAAIIAEMADEVA